jgi:hypothetical protein
LTRKLLLLNLILLAAAAWAVVQLRAQYQAASRRDAAMLGQKLKPAPPPPYTPLLQVPPVVATAYSDIAQKMLFDKSRNPVVVVEPPPSPPPKIMPPLPVLHGMMNIGDGIIGVFSEKENTPDRDLRPGETIGQFKLVSVNPQEVVLEWDGVRISKRPDELERRKIADNGPAGAVAAPAASPVTTVINVAPAPGADVGAGLRACTPGDKAPAGTVVDGYRKVESDTPFGKACRWEPAK